MCCLTYEQKGYESLRRGLPKTGKRVQLVDGRKARVRDIDVLRRLLRVQLDEGGLEVISADDVKQPVAKAPQAGAPASGKPRSDVPPRDQQ
jgi:cell fate regulator YaaT (PSP1 superfamily)